MRRTAVHPRPPRSGVHARRLWRPDQGSREERHRRASASAATPAPRSTARRSVDVRQGHHVRPARSAACTDVSEVTLRRSTTDDGKDLTLESDRVVRQPTVRPSAEPRTPRAPPGGHLDRQRAARTARPASSSRSRRQQLERPAELDRQLAADGQAEAEAALAAGAAAALEALEDQLALGRRDAGPAVGDLERPRARRCSGRRRGSARRRGEKRSALSRRMRRIRATAPGSPLRPARAHRRHDLDQHAELACRAARTPRRRRGSARRARPARCAAARRRRGARGPAARRRGCPGAAARRARR